MRTFLVVSLLLLFITPAFAKMPDSVSSSLPQGVFKKNYRGQIVQYDSKGKKIGVYEVKNGRFVKIK